MEVIFFKPFDQKFFDLLVIFRFDEFIIGEIIYATRMFDVLEAVLLKMEQVFLSTHISDDDLARIHILEGKSEGQVIEVGRGSISLWLIVTYSRANVVWSSCHGQCEMFYVKDFTSANKRLLLILSSL